MKINHIQTSVIPPFVLQCTPKKCFYEILHGLLVVLGRSAIAIVMHQWGKQAYIIYGTKRTAEEK